MRLLVVGCSGSGKTTMGKALSRACGLPHVELDGLNWTAGWRDLAIHEPDEFFRRVSAAAAEERWVMDGNYTKAREAHWARATAIIWMDTPRWRVMPQVIWRSFTRAVSKKELWPGTGNRELFRRWLDKEHPIRWAWDTHAMIRERYGTWFADGTYEGKPVYRIRTRGQAKWLVAQLAADAAPSCLPGVA
jgi:adenylate kinase family enzyme